MKQKLFIKKNFHKTLLVLLLLGYVGIHAADLSSIYSYRLVDYENVVPVIHELVNPKLFPEDKAINRLETFQRLASPLYHGLFTIPISQFFHPVTTMKIIGVIITTFLFILAGYPWASKIDWFRGLFIGGFFLHSGLPTSPLPGNRRSFFIVFLVAGITIIRSNRWLPKYILVGLSAGIYPPASVFLVTLFTFSTLGSYYYDKQDLHSLLLRIITMCLIVATVLSPFVIFKLAINTESLSHRVPDLHYNISTINGFVKSFLVDSRGALFRFPGTLKATAALIIIATIIWFILGFEKADYRREYGWLLLTSFCLWVLAHILHPRLHQPSKYMKLGPQIIGLYFVSDNLKAFLNKIQIENRSLLTSFLHISLSVAGGSLFVIHRSVDLTTLFSGLENSSFLLHSFFFRCITLGLLFLGLVALIDNFSKILRILMVGTFILLLFYPHTQWFHIKRGYAGHLPSYFKKAFNLIQSQPVSTRVASNNGMAMLIPMYAKRSVYFRQRGLSSPLMDKRARRFKKFYCTSSSATVARFLIENSIDLVFIDRQLWTNRYCGNLGSDSPLLETLATSPIWAKESYELHTSRSILRNLKDRQ